MATVGKHGLFGIPWSWVLFWFVIIMYVVNDPQGAAANGRSLIGWLQDGAQAIITFFTSLAGG